MVPADAEIDSPVVSLFMPTENNRDEEQEISDNVDNGEGTHNETSWTQEPLQETPANERW
jgi:hypothetical protein